MSESVHKLKVMSNELGTCIEKARPYYEARRKAKEVCKQQPSVTIRSLESGLLGSQAHIKCNLISSLHSVFLATTFIFQNRPVSFS